MKKGILIFITMLMLSVTLCAQKKVAVYVTGKDDGINKVLGDKLVEAFVKNGKYIAVERTSGFLAELKKEQNYQRTGEVTDSEISELGKQFGVEYVCVADIYDVYSEKYVSARLIDVESVEIINSANVNTKLDNMNELLRVSVALANGLTAKTSKELAEEQAAKEAAEQAQLTAIRKQYEAEQNEIKHQLNQGILQVEDLQITFPSPDTKYYWKEVKKEIKACHVGEKTDWRLPTELEVKKIASFLDKHMDKKKYPAIYEEISDMRYAFYHWEYNLWYVGNKYKDAQYLMLVRDAK